MLSASTSIVTAMDQSPSDDIDNNLLKMDLTENVADELEDFILCARLGLRRQAREAINHILIHHVNIFAVFAEIGSFFLEDHDYDSLEALFNSLASKQIEYTAPSERLFTEALNQILCDAHTRLDDRMTIFNIQSQNIDYEDPVLVSQIGFGMQGRMSDCVSYIRQRSNVLL